MGTLRVSFLSGAALELAATLGVALVAVTVGVRLVNGGLGLQGGADDPVLAPELYLPLRRLDVQYHASADGLAVADRLLSLLEAPPTIGSGGTAAAPSPAAAVRPAGRRVVLVSGAAGAGAGRRRLRAPVGRDRGAGGRERRREARSAACSCCWRRRPRSRDRRRRRSRCLQPGAVAAAGRLAAAASDVFRGTVDDNIRLGDPKADEERVRTAAGWRGSTKSPAQHRAATRPSSATAGDRSRRGAPADRARARVPARRAARGARRADPANLDSESAGSSRPSTTAGGTDVLVIAHRPELVRHADRIVGADPGPHRRGKRGGRRVIATLSRLIPLAGISRRRAALAVLLGSLAVGLIALMATAGYLISRAAERPPILSLTIAIVAVHFFGLARPLALPRQARLARRGAAVAQPGSASASTGGWSRWRRGTRGLPARRGAGPDGGGRRLAQGLARALGPPLVALLVGAQVGLVAGFPPLGRGRPRRRTSPTALRFPRSLALARHEPGTVPARRLTAELVELLRGAPELVACGREAERSTWIQGRRRQARSFGPARRAHRRPRRRAEPPRRRSDDRGRACRCRGRPRCGNAPTACSWRRSRCSRCHPSMPSRRSRPRPPSSGTTRPRARASSS